MLRIAISLALVTAASSLGAQSQADSAAILAAARAVIGKLPAPSADTSVMVFGKRDNPNTRTPDEIKLQADTALVTVWVSESREGREGQIVRVERRAGQWTVTSKAISSFISVRY